MKGQQPGAIQQGILSGVSSGTSTAILTGVVNVGLNAFQGQNTDWGKLLSFAALAGTAWGSVVGVTTAVSVHQQNARAEQFAEANWADFVKESANDSLDKQR